MVDVSSGRKQRKPQVTVDTATEAIRQLAERLGMNPMVLAQMANQGPESLAAALDKAGVPPPEKLAVQPSTGSAVGDLVSTIGQGLSTIPQKVEEFRQSIGGQPAGQGLQTYPSADITLPTTEVTAPPPSPVAPTPSPLPGPSPWDNAVPPQYPSAQPGLSSVPSPELTGMAQNPNLGQPLDTSTPSDGSDIGALLAGLKGVQAPQAPVGQRIDTPPPPRPSGTIQGGQLAALLQSLLGQGGFKPSPLTLNQALK